MAKPLLSQIFSPEKISKTAEAFIKLTPEQIQAIMRRKNQVDGRYVAADNLETALLGMYPDLQAPKPVNQVSSSAATEVLQDAPSTPAPEVAPPPVLPAEVNTSPNAQVNSTEVHVPQQTASPASHAVPQNMPMRNGQAEKDAFVASARAEVLKAYAAGAANSAQSVANEAQSYQKPEVAPSAESTNRNKYGLAA